MVQSLSGKSVRSDAYIVEVEGRFLVRPSPAIPKNKNEFRISNLTRFEAVVMPEKELTLQDGQEVPLRVGSQSYGEWNLKDLLESAYRYTVELIVGPGITVKAHGDSDPVIIIDPGQ
ncbi:MAG: hypothetical protein R6V57_17585 [Vicinamibacterales bacterium]